jgi:hypothetical protein
MSANESVRQNITALQQAMAGLEVGWTPKCLSCIGDFNVQLSDFANNITRGGFPTPEPDWDRDVNDAVTMAPQWIPAPGIAGAQGQMGIAVVPTCGGHLRTDQKTPAQRASESGLILGG